MLKHVYNTEEVAAASYKSWNWKTFDLEGLLLRLSLYLSNRRDKLQILCQRLGQSAKGAVCNFC